MKIFLILLMAALQPVFAGELIHIGEKYLDRQGHAFYPFEFKVPTYLTSDCAENAGNGRFDIVFQEDRAIRRFSCSVLLAQLSQLREFQPETLADTFYQFVLPKGDARKNFHQSNPYRNGNVTAYSNGVGFIFKRAGYSPIYINGVKENFEGYDRPIDGHYMEFQVRCEQKGNFVRGRDEGLITQLCPTQKMIEALRKVDTEGADTFKTNSSVPRGHPEYVESPYGI